MKITICEMKNILGGFNSRLDIAEKRLVNLKTNQWNLCKMKHREKGD